MSLIAGLLTAWAGTAFAADGTVPEAKGPKEPAALAAPAAPAALAAPAAPAAPAESPPAADKPPDSLAPRSQPGPTAADAAARPKAPSVKDIVVDAAAPTGDNPTGRQEPAVSIEWIGPASANVGQSVSYQIIVKNISASRVHQVVVHQRVPEGAQVTATQPRADTQDNMVVWSLGNLEPRQEKRLDLQVVPSATGNIACHAFVTFTGMSTTRLEVHEPKLAVKTFAPKSVIAGDPATVTVTVSNPGDATAELVKVKATLSEGLEHAHGKVIEFDLGNLAPSESRNVFVLCGAKAAGDQKCEVSATAEPRLTAQDTAAIDVQSPKVNVAVTGPGMRYLDRHAVFTFKVTNPGTAAASHVVLTDEVPPGFKVVAASSGGQHDFVARTVSWLIGELPPEKTKQVTLELVAVNPGEHKNKATVIAARGLRSEAEIMTRIEGLPALLMELVDLDDPLEVGAETSYEIRVTNTGTKTETNLQLTCTIPDKMEFRGARGAADCKFRQEGKDVVFDPLPKLAPRADAIYRVKVRGLAAGDLRFQARMKADGLSVPVLKEESTKVYGDEVELPMVDPKTAEPAKKD
jgi:uncharacterized repeat protein (TIGR01451 family)